ncbi:sensor histidine kinase [Microbacterium sp. NPDC055683]
MGAHGDDVTSFGDPRSRSVWLWQLVLAFGTVAIAAVVALLEPSLFTRASFIWGLTLVIAVTVATAAIPWRRLGKAAIFAVPAADIVAIGILAAASDVRLGFLWVFPIAWIATYYTVPWLIAALCGVGVVILVTGFTTAFTTTHALRLFIVIIALAFMGTTILIGSNRTRASARLLRRRSRQLQEALARAQQEEQRRAALLDTLQTGVAQVDPDGTIRTTNAAFRRMYGIEALAQLHPTRAVEYRERRGEPVPVDETTIARAARGETFSGRRVWLFDADGRWRVLEVAARYRLDGMIVVAEDVTAQSEAARERTSIARVVSHELRSPLTAVLGHTDLVLERDDLPAAAREQLRVVESAAERMERLIAGILQDPGRDPADCDTVLDLAAVVASSVDAFSPAATAGGVALERRGAESIPIMGDAFRLRQVIDNVVGNAVKYTPRGGRVAVEAELSDSGARVVVADTGIGIADDDLPNVFDAYFRSASARDSGLPGTGLGMGISRDIVAQHGGRLEVRSELGSGTAVTIHLPRSAADDIEEPA